MQQVISGDWSSPEEVFRDFGERIDWEKRETVNSEGIEILFATYTYEDYSGYAFVLFRKEGKIFEASGSHCSCNGLEGQWAPELADLAELKNRFEAQLAKRNDPEGYCYGSDLKTEDLEKLLEIIGALSRSA